MADVVVTLKIMPESPDTDIEKIAEEATKIISEYGEVGKKLIEPVAFGLNSLKLIFVMDEKKGGTDILEQKISEIPEVVNVEVTDVRRAMG